MRAAMDMRRHFLAGKRDGQDALLVAIDDAGDEPRVAQALVARMNRVRRRALTLTSTVFAMRGTPVNYSFAPPSYLNKALTDSL